MATRKKSIRDIRAQFQRIFDNSMDQTSAYLKNGGKDGDARDTQLRNRRYSARDTAVNYVLNIRHNNQFRNDGNEYRPYSQRVYMGLAQG